MSSLRESWMDDEEFLRAWAGYSDGLAYEMAQDAVDAALLGVRRIIRERIAEIEPMEGDVGTWDRDLWPDAQRAALEALLVALRVEDSQPGETRNAQ